MAATTMTSREFNQDTGRAKRATSSGPVIITDRGRPVHVLLSYEDYQRLTGGDMTIVDLLSLPEDAPDIDLDLPERGEHARGADLD
ncbi:type II toxin-antitoxin system Phd/YefM family antitoxin [Nocardia brasiliensis]|uniref:type II toxin-antitoxin system Phd/YefM family antitoxin n=1 Tax=Nocardia brasiliensis TaxID=37326 RepID=UPI0024557A31|nr:type II toxin-antitoxin system Phd/YefM family antitoxin [Nocardia brasiliensis]